MLGILGYLLLVGLLARGYHALRQRNRDQLRPPAQVIDFTTHRRRT
jgi:hypothetical protein